MRRYISSLDSSQQAIPASFLRTMHSLHGRGKKWKRAQAFEWISRSKSCLRFAGHQQEFRPNFNGRCSWHASSLLSLLQRVQQTTVEVLASQCPPGRYHSSHSPRRQSREALWPEEGAHSRSLQRSRYMAANRAPASCYLHRCQMADRVVLAFGSSFALRRRRVTSLPIAAPDAVEAKEGLDVEMNVRRR